MLRKLFHILALGLKELNSIRADPILLALTIYTFSYAVYAVATGAKIEVEHVSTAVVDEDHSELSQLIREGILPPFFKPPVEIAATEIGPSMDANRYVFVIEIPPKFESDVISGRYPTVEINADATAVAQAGNGAAYLQQIIGQQVQAYRTPGWGNRQSARQPRRPGHVQPQSQVGMVHLGDAGHQQYHHALDHTDRRRAHSRARMERSSISWRCR